ncbi:MAG: GrpB family protein [Actinomycetota bacterium]
MKEDSEMVGMGSSIVIVGYDPEWPVAFAAERERLRRGLDDAIERIDHVGSTSVPGMLAKPIIDIQISVAAFDPAGRYHEPLLGMGYIHRPDDEPRHRFYKLDLDDRTLFHVHVCESGKDWESDHLLFREFLRAHPIIAEKYGEQKREAASHFTTDRDRYMNAKAPHLAGLMEQARRWFASTKIHGLR